MATNIFCDGIQRRDFLKVGALAGLGMSLPRYLALAEAGGVSPHGKAKAAIYIRLAGGPSHVDTFDLKPGAPDTHRGEFKEIKTNVPGVRICEHLPKLAKQADKFAILRGVHHTLAAHGLGSEYLASGTRPSPALKYPSYGAVVSKEFGSAEDLPAFVAIPRQDAARTGYLGVEYGPFETGATPRAGLPLQISGLTLGEGVTLSDIERRQDMIRRYDNAFGDFGKVDKVLSGMGKFSQQAYNMMRSKNATEAFNLAAESPAIRAMFDNQPFSQSCMMAMRLAEAGVKFITVNLTGWDTHGQNFTRLKDTLLPQLDTGLAGLFQGLEAKGMLQSTAVFVTGEFGRTPKINRNAGRDHYPRAMFCLLAGGGIRGGRVVGESDAKGELPKGDLISPDDVAASFFQSLGIDPKKEYYTPTGRPVAIIPNGHVIPELFS
jgi:hypothetical protein